MALLGQCQNSYDPHLPTSHVHVDSHHGTHAASPTSPPLSCSMYAWQPPPPHILSHNHINSHHRMHALIHCISHLLITSLTYHTRPATPTSPHLSHSRQWPPQNTCMHTQHLPPLHLSHIPCMHSDPTSPHLLHSHQQPLWNTHTHSLHPPPLHLYVPHMHSNPNLSMSLVFTLTATTACTHTLTVSPTFLSCSHWWSPQHIHVCMHCDPHSPPLSHSHWRPPQQAHTHSLHPPPSSHFTSMATTAHTHMHTLWPPPPHLSLEFTSMATTACYTFI